MAKINWQDIGELTAVDAAGIGKAIIIPAKEALRQARFALTGNLTIRDNMYAAVVTLGYVGNSTQTLTHGVEYAFQNPLKTTPVGFTPIRSFSPGGSTALPVQSAAFNTTRTDGLMGVTIRFSPPVGAAHVRRDAAQTVTTAQSTTILFDAETYAYGSMSLTGGSVVLAESGIVAMSYMAGVTSGTAATNRAAWIYVASSSSRYGQNDNLSPASDALSWIVSGAQETQLSAGETVGVIVRQDSGGTLNTITSTSRPRFSVRYVEPPADYSALVTGILWGG